MGEPAERPEPHHLYQPYRLPGQQIISVGDDITTVTGTTIRCRGGYHPGSDRVEGGNKSIHVPLAPKRCTDPLGLERVISVYGPPAPDRAGAETPLVLTDDGGVTIYYDPETGDSMTFDSSNRIDRRSQRGAGDPYTGEVVGCENKPIRNIGSIWHNEDLYYRY